MTMGEYYYTNKNEIHPTWQLGSMQLKICGMNQNTAEVAALKTDYLGFIFWQPSKRHFKGEMPAIPHGIKKVGVFVNASIAYIVDKVTEFNLVAVQLHGNENAAFCTSLRAHLDTIVIIKVFSINDDYDFSELAPFENLCDFFLFDTKGKLPGGNGFAFDWKVLKNYPSSKPYFLSGGIGLGEIEKLKQFFKSPESKYCHAIDVNSKFEIEPGLKDVEKLITFKKVLYE